MNTTKRQEPVWILEKWEHGWLIKAPPYSHGIPMDTLSQVRPLMKRHAVVDGVLSNTLDAVFAIGNTKAAAELWRKELSQDPMYAEKLQRMLKAANEPVPDDFHDRGQPVNKIQSPS